MGELKGCEVDLIAKIQDSENPLSITDDELDRFTSAIKRARGDREQQLRRVIRLNIAKHHDWNFAMDGGFMPKEGQLGWPAKEWQTLNAGMFGAAYARYERLALYLYFDHGMSLADIEALSVSSIDKYEEQ